MLASMHAEGRAAKLRSFEQVGRLPKLASLKKPCEEELTALKGRQVVQLRWGCCELSLGVLTLGCLLSEAFMCVF